MILTKLYKPFAALSLGLGLTLASCSSSDDVLKGGTSVIGDRTTELNDFDKWLEENFVLPYNIEVSYTLDDNASTMRYHLAPADKQKSIQLAHLMKYLCIEPYDEVYGSRDFIRQLFPKLVQFIGSPAYNTNGTTILGTAEGGRKMVLYRVNQLNTNSTEQMNEYYFHTLHHEFGHIQNQTKRFSEDFDKITPQGYTGDAWSSRWGQPSNVVEQITRAYITESIENFANKMAEIEELRNKLESGVAPTEQEQQRAQELLQELQTIQQDATFLREASRFNLVVKYIGGPDLLGNSHRGVFSVRELNALRGGFVTPYASSNADEDFVEVQSCYITDSPEKWQARLLIAATGTEPNLGEVALQEKFNAVKTYLATDWKIDLDKLRESVQRRQAALPTLEELNSLTLKQGGN